MPLAPRFCLFSFAHYLWEPQLHKGERQLDRPKLYPLQLLPCYCLASDLEAHPFPSVYNVTSLLGFLIYPHSAPRVPPLHSCCP